MMKETKILLGSFYWAEEIGVDDIIANDFDFDTYKRKGIQIVARESLCDCGNYGEKIQFLYKGREYEFNFLTGYPCQCE